MIVNLDHCIWLYQIIHNLLSFLVFLLLIIRIELILIPLTNLIFYLSTLLFILGPSRWYFALLKCCIIFPTINCHLIYNYPSTQSRWRSPCSVSFQTLRGLIACRRSDQRRWCMSTQLSFLWPWWGIFVKIYAYMPLRLLMLLLGGEVGVAGESLVHLEKFKVLLWTEENNNIS